MNLLIENSSSASAPKYTPRLTLHYTNTYESYIFNIFYFDRTRNFSLKMKEYLSITTPSQSLLGAHIYSCALCFLCSFLALIICNISHSRNQTKHSICVFRIVYVYKLYEGYIEYIC